MFAAAAIVTSPTTTNEKYLLIPSPPRSFACFGESPLDSSAVFRAFVQPIIERYPEAEPADQGEHNEPVPTHRPDRVAGEVIRHDPQHQERLDHERQSEPVP